MRSGWAEGADPAFTRLRDQSNREVRLGSYELFQRSGPLQGAVWEKMMRGLSTRNYGPVVKDFASSYGVEKSAVSEHFLEASKEKLKALMERPLTDRKLCALLIDGTPFKGRQMIVALGIGHDGAKTVLGLREGATENTAVVSGLLRELAERGLDLSTPRLYILDGGKALTAAVKKACRRGGVDSALSGSQKAQRDRPLAGRTQSGREAETAERLLDGRIRRREAGAGSLASGTDGH